jgi:hypothetical protein
MLAPQGQALRAALTASVGSYQREPACIRG